MLYASEHLCQKMLLGHPPVHSLGIHFEDSMDEMPTGRIFLKLAKVAAGSVYRAIGTKVASVCVYDSPHHRPALVE